MPLAFTTKVPWAKVMVVPAATAGPAPNCTWVTLRVCAGKSMSVSALSFALTPAPPSTLPVVTLVAVLSLSSVMLLMSATAIGASFCGVTLMV